MLKDSVILIGRIGDDLGLSYGSLVYYIYYVIYGMFMKLFAEKLLGLDM